MPNDITLKEYLEAQIKWLDRHFDNKVVALDRAVEKAEQQLNKRLEGMNEFRDTLKDQAGQLATKEQLSLLKDILEERLRSLETSRARIIGIAIGMSFFVSLAVTAVVQMLR